MRNIPKIATVATDFGHVMLSDAAAELVSPHVDVFGCDSRRFMTFYRGLQQWLQAIYERGGDTRSIVVRASQVRKWIAT